MAPLGTRDEIKIRRTPRALRRAYVHNDEPSFRSRLETPDTPSLCTWSTFDLQLNTNSGINWISAATIGGEPMFLVSPGNGGALLGKRRPDDQWNFVPTTFRGIARLAGWNDRPSIVGTANTVDPHELYFDYQDNLGNWLTEPIVVNNQLRDFDFDVVQGIPVVTYVDVQGADAGLHVTWRRTDGEWQNSRIADASPADVDGTDIFSHNGLLNIVYWHGPTNTLRLIQQVPEPSTLSLGMLAVILCSRRLDRVRGHIGDNPSPNV